MFLQMQENLLDWTTGLELDYWKNLQITCELKEKIRYYENLQRPTGLKEKIRYYENFVFVALPVEYV